MSLSYTTPASASPTFDRSLLDTTSPTSSPTDDHHDEDHHVEGTSAWYPIVASLLVNMMTLSGVVFIIPIVRRLSEVKTQPVDDSKAKSNTR